jgi:hypothetical protein
MTRTITITTLTTAAVAEPSGGELQDCEKGRTCEGVHTLADRPGVYYVIATEVTDLDELAAFRSRIGKGEILGRVQRPILDEVPR